MDENRTDFFSNTPDDTVSHGADSVQPPLSEQTDAVVSMKQEQEPATQSQATSAMPTDAAGQMRAQATQHAQQTVDSFFGTQNPNGCTYAYGRAQQPQAQSQPQAQPTQQPSAAAWSATPPVYNTAPRTSAQDSASGVKTEPSVSAKKKTKKQKKEKKQKSRMSFGQFALCVVLCLVVSSVSGYVSSKTAVHDLLDEYMETFSTAENTTGSYNINIFEQPVVSTEPNTQANSESATVPVVNTSASDIYKQNVNAVVNITAVGYKTINYGFFFGSQTQEFTSSGTGFFITEDGYILTNYHVVEETEKITVTDYEGNEYTATLIGFEESNDIAVLKISGTFQAVQIGSSETLEVGDTLLIIGNALGELQYTLTQGVVSYLERAVTTETGDVINMFQTDAAINSGNSGGPVFNSKGEAVGIASAKYASSSIEGLGFCIPVDDVKSMISDIINVGYVTGKPSLGVSLYTNSGRNSGLPVGCYVVAVGSGSACHKAGIVEGDVITAIAGETVRDTDDVAKILSDYKAGDSITLTVYSVDARSSFNVTATLDEYVPAEARTEYTNVYDF
ncbi:MAG: serine protease [Clostridia bacterium]|nr:serine protease [Clostridia bacterium]